MSRMWWSNEEEDSQGIVRALQFGPNDLRGFADGILRLGHTLLPGAMASEIRSACHLLHRFHLHWGWISLFFR